MMKIVGGDDPRRERRWVYFVEAEGLGLIKIGVANCVRTRLACVAKICPVPLRLLTKVRTDKRGSLEKELHARFAAHRAHGERFRADPEILDYIAMADA